MASDNKPLRRLPGRGRKTFGLISTTSTRLYLEDDHLLYVANDRFTESYMRFYFRDVQALLLCRTNSAKSANLALTVVIAFFSLLGLLGDYSWNWGGAGLAVCGSITFFFLLLLVINLVKGPSCLCHLKTAVHTEELPSLNRVRAARKAFALLRPAIEAAQSQLAGPEMPAAPVAQDANAATPLPTPYFSNPPFRPLKHEPGRFHEILCYVLLGDSAITALDIFYDSIWLTVVGSLVGFGALAATVMALVRQNESDIGRGLRAVAWGSLGYQGTMLIFGFGFTIYLTVKHQVQTDNQWEMIRLWSRESALDSPVLFWTFTFSTVAALALGLAGLVLLREHRRRTPTPPPLDSPAETPAAPG